MITNNGLSKIASYLTEQLSSFKVGTGNSAESEDDTDLDTPVYSDNVYAKGNSNTVSSTESILPVGTADGDSLVEFGVFLSDSSLFKRIVHPVISKNSSEEILYIERTTFLRG